MTRNVHIIIISNLNTLSKLNLLFLLYFKFIDNSQFPQFSSNYMYMQGSLENEYQNNDDDSSNWK